MSVFSPDTRKRISVLASLALPVMLEQLSQILLGTVDTYFAGSIGDSAIAAVSAANMYTNLCSTMFSSLGMGVMVLIGLALGAGNSVRANRVIRQAVLLGGIVGILLGGFNLAAGGSLLSLTGARDEILSMARKYFAIVCGPCVLSCWVFILSSGLKSAKNTRASMQAALIANILNAVLDGVFIRLGLGAFGLGLATTVARGANVLLLVLAYIRRVTVLSLDGTLWSGGTGIMKEVIRYSLPVMLTHFSTRLCMLVHGSMILRLGSEFYVANSITVAIDDYACIPSAGFEAATATSVSHCTGAGDRRGAAAYTKTAFRATAFCMTFLGLVLAVFSEPLSSLFTDTPEVRDLVGQILWLMVFFNWTSSMSHIFTSAVQGSGDSRTPFFVTLACDIAMRLGVGCVLAFCLHLNLLGIWIGIILDFLARGILLGRKLRQTLA